MSSCEYVSISLEEVIVKSIDALARLNLPLKVIESIVEQILYAEMSGKRTHGLVRIPWLLRVLRGRAHEEPIITNKTSVVTRFDCKHSIGYAAADTITDYLIGTLSSERIHICICADIYPTSVLGFYTRKLVSVDCVSVAFGTTPPLVRTKEASKSFLGTNPLAVGIPGYEGKDFLCDITTATSSFGEVLLASYEGTKFNRYDLLDRANAHPASVDEVFEDGRFVGSVIQNLDTRRDYRGFSLLMAIEMMTALLAGCNSRVGNLIIIACKKRDVLLGALLDDDGGFDDFFRSTASALRPHDLPGTHSQKCYRESQERGRLDIPRALWETISDSSVCG